MKLKLQWTIGHRFSYCPRYAVRHRTHDKAEWGQWRLIILHCIAPPQSKVPTPSHMNAAAVSENRSLPRRLRSKFSCIIVPSCISTCSGTCDIRPPNAPLFCCRLWHNKFLRRWSSIPVIQKSCAQFQTCHIQTEQPEYDWWFEPAASVKWLLQHPVLSAEHVNLVSRVQLSGNSLGTYPWVSSFLFFIFLIQFSSLGVLPYVRRKIQIFGLHFYKGCPSFLFFCECSVGMPVLAWAGQCFDYSRSFSA